MEIHGNKHLRFKLWAEGTYTKFQVTQQSEAATKKAQAYWTDPGTKWQVFSISVTEVGSGYIYIRGADDMKNNTRIHSKMWYSAETAQAAVKNGIAALTAFAAELAPIEPPSPEDLAAIAAEERKQALSECI